MVANSVHHHDQSISLGIYDSDTAWWPDWNEAALCHAGRTSVIVSVEEHSLRVMAVHLAKHWHKYHLSGIVGKCTDQWVGHQWHRTTRLRKSDVDSCFQQFLVDYHDPINGSIVDSITSKKGFIIEQNLTNHMGVRINPKAQFQPATHVCRFKMLNALDVVWLHSFCV